jgi:hypothetical protein
LDCVFYFKDGDGFGQKGRLSGFRRTDRPFGSHSRGNKGILAAQEMFGSAFRQNFDEISPGT